MLLINKFNLNYCILTSLETQVKLQINYVSVSYGFRFGDIK